MIISDRNYFYHEMDIGKFLKDKASFLRIERVGKDTFATHLDKRCQAYNISPRVVLTLLDLRAGLLARKTRPDDKVLHWCLGMVPYNSEKFGQDYSRGLPRQIEAAMSALNSFYREGRFNAQGPLKMGSLEFSSLNPASYAVLQYLWLVDRDPDSIERFKKLYAKRFGNTPDRGPTQAPSRSKGKRVPAVPHPVHNSKPRPVPESSGNVLLDTEKGLPR